MHQPKVHGDQHPLSIFVALHVCYVGRVSNPLRMSLSEFDTPRSNLVPKDLHVPLGVNLGYDLLFGVLEKDSQDLMQDLYPLAFV